MRETEEESTSNPLATPVYFNIPIGYSMTICKPGWNQITVKTKNIKTKIAQYISMLNLHEHLLLDLFRNSTSYIYLNNINKNYSQNQKVHAKWNYKK